MENRSFRIVVRILAKLGIGAPLDLELGSNKR